MHVFHFEFLYLCSIMGTPYAYILRKMMYRLSVTLVIRVESFSFSFTYRVTTMLHDTQRFSLQLPYKVYVA